MSIKSQRNNLDLNNMLNKNKHVPKYIANSKSKTYDAKNGQIDMMSDYIKENLTKAVKPRHGERR